MKAILLSLVLLVLGCSSENPEKYTTNSQALHSWSGYHWARTSNEVTLNLSSNLSPTWVSYLGTASSDWNLSSVLETTVTQGSKNPKRCQPTLGKVEVCNSNYGKNGWLGIAQIWVSGGHITQAVVKLNDSYFNMAKYNTVSYRHLVMCQEVGHTFGLNHQDENQTNQNLGTCMDYTSNPSGPPSNEHPNAHDYEQLESIYAHLDTTTVISQQSEIDPNQWGQLRAANNNSQSFVFDLGNEEFVLTHVLNTD